MAMLECSVCGHANEIPKTTRAAKPAAGDAFPVVVPSATARNLHADHVARRDGIAVTRGCLDARARKVRKPGPKQGKREHPRDWRLRIDHPDIVRFLRECSAAGHVARFHADDDQADAVRVWLAGPRGVFHPLAPITVTVADIRQHADRLAVGTAWETLGPLAAVAA